MFECRFDLPCDNFVFLMFCSTSNSAVGERNTDHGRKELERSREYLNYHICSIFPVRTHYSFGFIKNIEKNIHPKTILQALYVCFTRKTNSN
jgi:hypothetical protein